MVIKTDELPAAAPADSAREPSSQAGGKGRPGAAGEWGRGQGAAGREAGPGRVRGWVWGGAGTAAFSPRLTGRISPSPPPGAPALKVTFTVAPGCGPDFTHVGSRGGQRRRTHACQIAGTRARTRGFGVRRLRRSVDSAAPPPTRLGLGNSPDWGHLTLAPSSTPLPSGSLAFPVHPAAALRVRHSLGLLTLGLWEDLKLRVCVLRGAFCGSFPEARL